jgi:hypothetical protein
MMLERFKNVMPTYAQAYSVRWRVAQSSSEKGKKEAKYKAVRQTPTDAVLLGHFSGKEAVSMLPLVEHADPSLSGKLCQWGAIDVDAYGDPTAAETIARKLAAWGFRCYAEASKSGGAHIYIILNQPVMAGVFRKYLKKITHWLGLPASTTELRPAQNEVDLSAGDLGHFMVLPGFNRPIEDVVPALEAAVMSVQEFDALLDEGELVDGPPCLFPQVLAGRTGEWSNRNKFTYQLAVFFKNKYPANFQEKVREYLDKEMGADPLPADEIANVLKGVETNAKFKYMCKGDPFEGVCDKALCQTRKFGIAMRDGASTVISSEGITQLETDPPTWFITMNLQAGGQKRVKLTTQQLYRVGDFKKRCLEELRYIPSLPKQDAWEAYLTELLKKVHVVPVPFEMTEAARMLEAIYQFVLSSPKSTAPEGLLRGRILAQPWEGGLTAMFRTVDFANYLERRRVRGISAADLYTVLTELQGHGKARTQRISIPPAELDVWVVDVESQYLQIKTEIDLEKCR